MKHTALASLAPLALAPGPVQAQAPLDGTGRTPGGNVAGGGAEVVYGRPR